ncbi:MAG: sigma-70 family RNA polymerase sigma factor [Phycisphaerales bacterium]|nr:MAG: sigma-70 family RNA polymerase sigma factor [Phycisphaerales bacterium]
MRLKKISLAPFQLKRDTGITDPPAFCVFFLRVFQKARASMTSREHLTQTLNSLGAEDPAPVDQLMNEVYSDLRERAAVMLRDESPANGMQPTVLVHEAYLRLVDQNRITWQGKSHFRAIAAMAMHRVFIDHVRYHKCQKRGKDWRKISLDDAKVDVADGKTDILTLHQVLERLRDRDPEQFQIVQLRIFGGLTMKQIAEVTKVPMRTAEREWAMAKMWLKREIERERSHAR